MGSCWKAGAMKIRLLTSDTRTGTGANFTLKKLVYKSANTRGTRRC
jgi:hypothetical protein